jgi:hypothetical protein
MKSNKVITLFYSSRDKKYSKEHQPDIISAGPQVIKPDVRQEDRTG